jgi:hypothetical protein
LGGKRGVALSGEGERGPGQGFLRRGHTGKKRIAITAPGKETEKAHYSRADYCAWEPDRRYGIIDGEAFMTAASSMILRGSF